MSKKSRKRNKKILAALALAGGAAMLARGRGKGVAQGVSGADKAAFTSDAAYKLPAKNWITKKSVPVDTTVTNLRKPPIGKMRGVGTDAEAIAGQNLRALHAVKANAPKGIMHPVYGQPTRTIPRVHVRGVNRAKGGSAYKKGGRVTGIAKRGFGRALMKGKK